MNHNINKKREIEDEKYENKEVKKFKKESSTSNENTTTTTDTENLFFKVFRNIYIRNLISNCQIMDMVNRNAVQSIYSLQKFKYKNHMERLIIRAADINNGELEYQYLKNEYIPNTIKSITINRNVEIQELPDQLKEIYFWNSFYNNFNFDLMPSSIEVVSFSNYCNVTIPTDFNKFSSLKYLSIDRFSKDLINHLYRFTGLTKICINYASNKIKFGDIKLPPLTKELEFGELFNQRVDQLQKLKQIESIKFGNSFSFKIKYLPKNLKSLSIGCNKCVTPSFFKKLLKLKKLENIIFYTDIENENLQEYILELKRNLKNLKYLQIFKYIKKI